MQREELGSAEDEDEGSLGLPKDLGGLQNARHKKRMSAAVQRCSSPRRVSAVRCMCLRNIFTTAWAGPPESYFLARLLSLGPPN